MSLATAARWSFDRALVAPAYEIPGQPGPGLGAPAGPDGVAVEREYQTARSPHGRELPHGRPVDRGRHDLTAVRRSDRRRTGSGGHVEARHQSLHVPLERARDGLVEVVDVEDQVALGGGEPAEIGEMGVTAELDLEAGAGRRRGRRPSPRPPPVEGKRRRHHASVADGHKLGDADRVLVGQDRERVPTGIGRLQVSELRAGH